MWPLSPFAHPVSSYERPVPLVSVDPCDNPDLTVSFRSEWLPYILGSLKQLVLQSTWLTSDPDALQEVVGRAEMLLTCFSNAPRLVPDIIRVEEMGLDMAICEQLRFQDGKLQGLCCGEWTDITGQPAQGIGGPGQPAQGAPQPTPNGGTADYNGCFNSNGVWLIPTPLSTGDVVNLSGATGAASGDGGTIWNCPDGSVFFAGGCLAIGATIGTDPLPTTNHMSLIMFLDGDYYDLMAGPVTVPAGVSNVQGFIQVNDDDLTNNVGQLCFNVEVTNNQLGTFSHDFDFTLTPAGWTVRDIGQYVVGQGFEAVYSVPIMTADIQSPVVGAFTLTRMVVTVDNSGQSGGSNIAFGKNTPGVYFYNVTNVNGHVVYDTGVISETGVTILYVDAFLDTSLATGITRQVHIEGIGPDPF